MKTKILGLFLALLTMGIFYACSEKEVEDSSNNTADVVFKFNIGDYVPVRTATTPPTTEYQDAICTKTPAELQTLAVAGKLFANITIREIADPNPINLKIRSISGGVLQADAYPLAIAAAGSTYHIDAVTIVDDMNNVLYTGVGEGSKYKEYILQAERMGTKAICLNKENHLYKKTAFDLWVLCAEEQTPEDFGFAKWNFKFVKSTCIPVFVNKCTTEKGDYQPAGYIKVEYKVGVAGTYTTLHKEGELAFGEGKYGSICFKDDYQVDDAQEIHRLSLYVEGKLLGTAEVTTKQLKLYADHEDWNEALNFMHIDLCNCKTYYFNLNCTEPTDTECVRTLSFLDNGASADNIIVVSDKNNPKPIIKMNTVPGYLTGYYPMENGMVIQSQKKVQFSDASDRAKIHINITHRHILKSESVKASFLNPTNMLLLCCNKEEKDDLKNKPIGILTITVFKAGNMDYVGSRTFNYKDGDNLTKDIDIDCTFSELVKGSCASQFTDGCYIVQVAKKCHDDYDQWKLHLKKFTITRDN